MVAVKRIATWYHARKRTIRITLTLVALALVFSAYLGVRSVALRSADSLTITILQDGKGFIYAHNFGPSLAQEAQRILNDPSLAEPYFQFLGYGEVHWGFHPYYGPAWRYTLTFAWHGLVIESASMVENGSPETYSISALGLPDPRAFLFNGAKLHSLIDQLSQDGHVAIPQSPYYSPQPVAGS